MENAKLRAAVILLVWALGGVAYAIPEGPEANTPEWGQREAENYAKVSEAPAEQLSNPVFLQRLTEQGLANEVAWAERIASDPSWVDPRSGNTQVTPLCTSWSMQCAGDPFRYPGFDPFYEDEAEVQPVLFYDESCARISGRVWKPKGAADGDNLPAIVIENGSVQAPETLYWWAAQMLVRAGYTVMTFDPRGQGRSDQQTPDGQQGSNANPTVFWDGLVNAIDFFRSSEHTPYPHNETCAGTYPTVVTAYNPFVGVADPDRLGLAGHSLGARGVSVVQGLDPWPGLIDAENPVDVIVAWDGLSDPDEGGAGGAAGALAPLEPVLGGIVGGDAPVFTPRVPAMGHSSEYGLTPAPFLQPPDPEGHKAAFAAWKDAGVPAYQLTIQGSSHYEWSLIPTFPTTSWCPSVTDGQCDPGWGLPLAEHYTLAWFDRWLKEVGEAGYATADARLTADEDWVERMSFYYRSARAYPDRAGKMLVCEDIRAGLVDEGATACAVAGADSGTGDDDTGDDESDNPDAGTTEDEEDDAPFNGCVIGSSSIFDPLWLLMLLGSGAVLWRRSRRTVESIK